MTTIYVSADRSFQIKTGAACTPRARCRHVQPDVVDFPGICDRAPNHNGDHQAAVAYGGSLGQFPPIRWANTTTGESR